MNNEFKDDFSLPVAVKQDQESSFKFLAGFEVKPEALDKVWPLRGQRLQSFAIETKEGKIFEAKNAILFPCSCGKVNVWGQEYSE